MRNAAGVSLLLLASVMGGALASDGRERQLQELHNKYRISRTELERLNVCIEAINKKLICEGCRVQNIDKIFSTDYGRMDKSRLGLDSMYAGTIRFVPVEYSKSPKETTSSSSYKGWYLGFKYTQDGRLYKYYLTNNSKFVTF